MKPCSDNVCLSVIIHFWSAVHIMLTRICGVMVSKHNSSAIKCRFELRSCWNPDNMYEWGDMSIRSLLFQWTSTKKIQLSMMDFVIISLKVNLFSPWYKKCSWKNADLTLSNNYALTHIMLIGNLIDYFIYIHDYANFH